MPGSRRIPGFGALLRLPSLRIGRIAGIPIELNVSWFGVFALVSGVLAFVEYPAQFPGRPMLVDVVSGLVTAALFFASIVVHEVAHSLVARRTGLAVDRVTLFLFGGVAQLLEEPSTPGREAVMAVAGPATSLAISLAAFSASQWMWAAGVTDVVWGPLEYLALINLSIAVFNLMPGFPMDGGRLVRAAAWWASGNRLVATRGVSLVGQGIGSLMGAGGVIGAVSGQGLQWLWLLPMGLFLRTLSAAAFETQRDRLMLARTPAIDAVYAPAPGLPSSASLSDSLGALAGAGSAMLVDDGKVVGVASLDGALRAVAERGPDAPASSAADEASQAAFVDASESLDEVSRRLADGRRPAVYVVQDGRIAGAVTRAQIATAVRTQVRG